MSGNCDSFLARDLRYQLTESGSRLLNTTLSHASRSASGSGSRRMASCLVCFGYCYGPTPYQGNGRSRAANRGSLVGPDPYRDSRQGGQVRDEVIIKLNVV